MVMLDNTVVNVALPSIQRDLQASLSSLEWTVNAYTLTFAVLLVTGGRLGDIFGRRRMFLFGVVVFALSSATIGRLSTMRSTSSRTKSSSDPPTSNCSESSGSSATWW
jgi:MFS family permease